MTLQTTETVLAEEPSFAKRMFRMLLADKFALCAAIFLLVILGLVIFMSQRQDDATPAMT